MNLIIQYAKTRVTLIPFSLKKLSLTALMRNIIINHFLIKYMFTFDHLSTGFKYDNLSISKIKIQHRQSWPDITMMLIMYIVQLCGLPNWDPDVKNVQNGKWYYRCFEFGEHILPHNIRYNLITFENIWFWQPFLFALFSYLD